MKRERWCASKQPSTRNIPITTHAPPRSTFPKAAQLEATHPTKKAKQATKSQNNPQNAPNDAKVTNPPSNPPSPRCSLHHQPLRLVTGLSVRNQNSTDKGQ